MSFAPARGMRITDFAQPHCRSPITSPCILRCISALQHQVDGRNISLIGAFVGQITLYAVPEIGCGCLLGDIAGTNALHGIATSGVWTTKRWIDERCIYGPYFRYTEWFWHWVVEFRSEVSTRCMSCCGTTSAQAKLPPHHHPHA